MTPRSILTLCTNRLSRSSRIERIGYIRQTLSGSGTLSHGVDALVVDKEGNSFLVVVTFYAAAPR